MLDCGGPLSTAEMFYVSNGERIFIGHATVNEAFSTDFPITYEVNWDITDVPDGTYTVVFSLTDAYEATVECETQITVDHSLPQPIAAVTVVNDVAAVYLNWGISSELDTTYRIYRRRSDETAFELLAAIHDRHIQSYTDTQVEGASTTNTM